MVRRWHKVKEEALRKIVSSICDDYIDTLLTGIEENEKDFPYTLACANFISELKEKNIIVNLYTTFDMQIVDMIYRETSNYLAR